MSSTFSLNWIDMQLLPMPPRSTISTIQWLMLLSLRLRCSRKSLHSDPFEPLPVPSSDTHAAWELGRSAADTIVVACAMDWTNCNCNSNLLEQAKTAAAMLKAKGCYPKTAEVAFVYKLLLG